MAASDMPVFLPAELEKVTEYVITQRLDDFVTSTDSCCLARTNDAAPVNSLSD